MKHQQVILIERPHGVPQPAHFELKTSTVARPQSGQFVVRNHFLSVDPAQRGYVNNENNYAPPLPLGSVMRALCVGEVVDSAHTDIKPGEFLYGWFGWQDYCVAEEADILRRIDNLELPLSLNAGLLGINGLTAQLALADIGQMQAGETLLVTAAAGAVGSLVGQLAHKAGVTAIAMVGSDAKGERCLKEFGYQRYINYRDEPVAALQRQCPDGIDIFFDNVAGPLADHVIRHMKLFGRVIQCGTMAIESWEPAPQGPRIEREILTRRLRMQGFVIFDHQARYKTAADALINMYKAGEINYAEDIETGIENAAQALVDVYAGRNQGKKLIQLV